MTPNRLRAKIIVERSAWISEEISNQELYEICTKDLKDVETLLASTLKWVRGHPELVDQGL